MTYIAQVTKQMGRVEGDLENGVPVGAEESVSVIGDLCGPQIFDHAQLDANEYYIV